MPDLGLSRAIRQAVLKGAKEAKVVRPGEIAELAPPMPPVNAPGSPAVAASERAKAQRAAAPAATPPPEPAAPAPAALEQPAVATPMAPGASMLDELPPAAPSATPEEVAGLDFSAFKLDESFQTNFDTITTTDQVKAVIADVSQRNAGRIDEARRGVITHEQLQGLAGDLAINEGIVRSVMERQSGGALNAETILGARQVLNSSAERIYNLGAKITQGQATDIEQLQFRRQIMWHADFQTQFMGARAEAGRALNAFNIPTGADIDAPRMRELVENLNGYDTHRLASLVALTDGSTASISKAARQYTQSKLMGVVNELFINSILSGPVTHIINATGNLMFQTMNMAETAVAARIGRFLGGDEHVLVGEATALAHGTVSAYRDGLRLAARTMRTGVALDDVVKYESATGRRSISATNLLSAEQLNTPLGRFAEALLDGVRIKGVQVPGVGQVIRAPTERVMAPTDELFKTLAYRGELERLAYLHAHDQVLSGAATKEQAADIAREFMENAPLKAQQAAEDYARYVTFQNPLGDKAAKFQLAINATPALKLLAPFIRTPINLFKAGIVDRSPLGMFSKKFWRTMKAGGRERDMMLARIGMGTATTSVVASYVMDGTITGGGPSNPEARALLEASGWQPYSIKVGDTYHSYARAEPFAFIIGATADAVEIMSYINSDVEADEDAQEHMNNVAAAIIVGVANNTMSKTFVKGLADFTEMLSDPTRYFDGWSRNTIPAFVPFASLRNEIGQIQDPYLREAWTVMDQIRTRSGLPGYSEKAPLRRDIMGQPRMTGKGSLLGTMSPFPEKVETRDFVLREIVNVMESTKTVPVTMPTKRIEGMRLNAVEYDQLTRMSRLEPAPNGRTFRDELDLRMNSTAYLTATPDTQAEVIRSVQSMYDDYAKARLELENPSFADRLQRHRDRRLRLRRGF